MIDPHPVSRYRTLTAGDVVSGFGWAASKVAISLRAALAKVHAVQVFT
jgi:hypothetical protein